MVEFDYPLAITRERYLTEVGGISSELNSGCIGIHTEAILTKTNLSPGDSVLLNSTKKTTYSKGHSPQPLFSRNLYRVEPITELHDSRLVAMSSDGEAILSSEDHPEIDEGEKIVLNAAVNNLPENWIE